VELNSLSIATELKLFSLVALTLIMLSGVYPLQFRGVYGDNDAAQVQASLYQIFVPIFIAALL